MSGAVGVTEKEHGGHDSPTRNATEICIAAFVASGFTSTWVCLREKPCASTSILYVSGPSKRRAMPLPSVVVLKVGPEWEAETTSAFGTRVPEGSVTLSSTCRKASVPWAHEYTVKCAASRETDVILNKPAKLILESSPVLCGSVAQ